MMASSMKHIKRQNAKNNRYKKFRKVAVPNHRDSKHIERPFAGEYNQGKFQNNIYSSIRRAVIVWTYIKLIVLHALPALAIHGFMKLVEFVGENIAKQPTEIVHSEGGMQILLIAYGICLFFGLRKVSDYMAYYNMTMLVSKYDINQKQIMMVYRAANPESLSNSKEFSVMDHYRMKYNKYSLFPSVKELAVEDQLYNEAHDDVRSRRKPVLMNYINERRERLSLMNKRDEHFAAKEIADWKQEQYGGPNEYDEMVKRYKHRTVPAIMEIVRDVQSQNF